MKNWYASAVRKMHFDMHTPGDVEVIARDFDGNEFARRLKAAGVQAVCYFSKCTYGWSYFPTEVGRVHPHLKRDLLGEAVAACCRSGIKFIAYYAVEVLPPPIADAHPEWLLRNPDGSAHSVNGRRMFCPRSEAADRLFIPHVLEVVEKYPVDGIFLDGYGAMLTPCYCEHCKRAFGRAIPTGPEAASWVAYLKWQRAQTHGIFARLAVQVHAIRPDALIGVNYLGANRYAEPVPAGVGYLTADYPVSNNCAVWTSYQLAGWVHRGLPMDVMNARMLHWWQDWTNRPVAAIKTEFAAAIAHGGTLFLGDVLPLDTCMPDPDVMDIAAESFAFAKSREAMLEDAVPLADVAIISADMETFGAGRGGAIDEAPLRGTFLALTQAGITAHILLESELHDHIGEYRTVVLPDQAALSDTTIALLQDFVASGGGLVVTGPYPTDLDELLGIRCEKPIEADRAYFRIPDKWAKTLWPRHERVRSKVLVHGRPLLVKCKGAQAICRLIGPGPIYQLTSRPPGKELSNPALTMVKAGRGRAAFAALPLGRDLFSRGNAHAGHVLAGLVRAVTPALTVEVDAPASVEIALARRKKQLIVHLLWYHAERRSAEPPIVEQVPPLHDVVLTVRMGSKPRRVRQVPGNKKLRWTRRGGAVKIKVNPFEVHTAIILE
ncbi:MAG: alpha-amylase family protein [Planctomycetota bacterium]